MNLLARETIDLNEGVGGWTAEANASLSRHPSFSPFAATLEGDDLLNSLKVETLAGGSTSIATEKVAVTAEETYKASAWLAAEVARTAEMTIRYYDSGDSLIAGSTAGSLTTAANTWYLLYALEEAPSNAVTADILIEWTGTLAGEENWVAFPALFNYYDIFSDFVNLVISNSPGYLWEADGALTSDHPTWPLARYLAVALVTGAQVESTIADWDYLRSTEGTESLSTLTSPYNADPEWLGWLAQQVGVELSILGAGGTSWASFVSANILDWDDWEQDIVSGGGATPDTTWVGIENYDPVGVLDALQGFQYQIDTGYNGVLSSSVNSMTNYVKAILNSTEDDPWTYIVKHYKGSPWLMAIVSLEGEDVDPGGPGLAQSLASGSPAGVKVFTLNNVGNSGSLFFDPNDFVESLGANGNDGYNALPLEGAGELRSIPDTTDMGRGIVLWGDATSAQSQVGGGITRARYFPEGHVLSSGYTKATTPSNALFNTGHDAIAIEVLVSDISPPASGSKYLAEMANTWTLKVKSDSQIEFAWTTDSSTGTYTTTTAPNWNNTAPFWLKIAMESTDVSTNSEADCYTYARETTSDEWVEIDSSLDISVTGQPQGNATNGITLFRNSDHADGFIYNFKYYTGPSLAALDELVIIDFLDTTDADIYPSSDGFTSTAPELGVAARGTLTIDTNPSDGDTITVDTKTYTFQTTLTNADGNVQIGAAATDTQSNLVEAFDLSGTAGTDYATAMTAHPSVDIGAFAANDAVLEAKEQGAAGNYIATTETFTAGTNVFDATSLGATRLGGGPGALAITISGADIATMSADRWVALKHDGTNDFFHFGQSPRGDDGISTANLGDDLSVNMGSSNTYYWTITYYDDTTDQASLTTTTITWDADDYGATAIKDITVRTGSHAGTIVAQMLPDMFEDDDTPVDAYSKTWTLSRGTETSGYFEESAYVDRSYFVGVDGGGYVEEFGFGPGASASVDYNRPKSLAWVVRRVGQYSGSRVLYDRVIADGPNGPYRVFVEYYDDDVRVQVNNGVRGYTLQWDETTPDRQGVWNLVVLRMDPALNKIELVVNGTVEDQADGFFPEQFLNTDSSAATSYASSPDSANLSITGDLDLRAKVKRADWDSGNVTLISKDVGTLQYRLNLNAGLINIEWFDGSSSHSKTAVTNMTTYVADGGVAAIRAALDADNGSSGHDVDFFYSLDFENWTQIGTTDTTAGTTSIQDNASELRVGAQGDGSNAFGEEVYFAEVWSGTVKFSVNFEDGSEWQESSASGTEAQGATVTLQGNARIETAPVLQPVETITSQRTTVSSGTGLGMPQMAHFSTYDRYLTDVEVAALIDEHSIT